MEKTRATTRGAVGKWAGSVILAFISLAAALPWIQQKGPVELWVGLVILALIGAALMLPVKAVHPEPKSQVEQMPSAFIRGDVTNSTIKRVKSDADVFVDGNVKDSRIYDIVFRGWKKA